MQNLRRNLAYKTRILPSADFDLLESATFIAEKEQSHRPARKWLVEMQRAVSEIRRTPKAFARIWEEFEGSDRLQEIHRHSHRIIYTVDEAKKEVVIIRFYHSSRKPLSAKQIKFE